MRQRHPGPGDGRSGAKYKPVAEGAGQRASKGMRCGIVGTGSLARSAGHLFRFREGGGTGSERETSAGRSGEAGRVPASRAGCDSERKAPAPPAPPPRPRLGRSRRSLPRPPGPPGHSATPSSLGLLCTSELVGSSTAGMGGGWNGRWGGRCLTDAGSLLQRTRRDVLCSFKVLHRNNW